MTAIRAVAVLICILLTSPTIFSQVDFMSNCLPKLKGNESVEAVLHDLINKERRRQGLSELVFDEKLRSAARQHSHEMLQLDYFAHTSPVAHLKNPYDRIYHSGSSDFTVGENIALHSLDKSTQEIAEKFVTQWMNSPPHKENILKPIFNTSGIGVISIKDSTITDTVRYGVPTKLITYRVRHYATQLFSDRSLSFTKIDVVREKREFLKIQIEFEYDRKMLMQIDNYHQVFEPVGQSVTIDVLYPIKDQIEISLANIQNDQDNSYRIFLEEKVTRNSIMLFGKGLSNSPVRVKSKVVAIVSDETFFLRARARLVEGRTDAALFLYAKGEINYYFDIKDGKIAFEIPLFKDNRIWEIELAFGAEAQKSVKNRILVDSKRLYDNDKTQRVFVRRCQ